MNYIGISAGFHDAAVSTVDQFGNIKFAGHSERYSKEKNDGKLCPELVRDALNYTHGNYELHYYERPWLKAIRQLRAGQKIGPLFSSEIIGKDILKEFKHKRITNHTHHLTHAAAGFQTSPYHEATVVIIDAIGELDTISIWNAKYDDRGIARYNKIWGRQYPNSIGLLYSAMTARVGLKPLDEEYIFMGMAAYGKAIHVGNLDSELIADRPNLIFKQNLHTGVSVELLQDANEMNIAASTQVLTENLIGIVMSKARLLGRSRNLVFGGGVALNCVANKYLGEYFKHIWVMPNPGDAGNSLGAAALGYGGKLKWENAFLGHDIPGAYPIDSIIAELHANKIVGVASGRAEFGPRALGNRSLLADPRGPDIKDRVNEIKHRQKFRPFAPMILEEHLYANFKVPYNWENTRYMQVVAKCKKPDLYPAICHIDNSSRVQSVPDDDSGVRRLLEQWYKETGCPMLLNTSLNIRGEPMVNDLADAKRFENLYRVRVCS